jgi:hypothetical protein
VETSRLGAPALALDIHRNRGGGERGGVTDAPRLAEGRQSSSRTA